MKPPGREGCGSADKRGQANRRRDLPTHSLPLENIRQPASPETERVTVPSSVIPPSAPDAPGTPPALRLPHSPFPRLRESPFHLAAAIPKPENAFILSPKWEMPLPTRQLDVRPTGGTQPGWKVPDSFPTTIRFPNPQKAGGHLGLLVGGQTQGTRSKGQSRGDMNRSGTKGMGAGPTVARQHDVRLQGSHCGS